MSPMPPMPPMPTGPSPMMPDPMMALPTPTGAPTAEEMVAGDDTVEGGVEEPLPSDTPSQNLNTHVFEDYFPPLALSEEEEKSISAWFDKDLKACVRHINNNYADKWAIYRLMFLLEYVEKFYPSMSSGMDFTSGLLCEKTLDGMNRLTKAIFGPRPFFMVDDKTSNLQDMELIHRCEWFLQTVFEKDLDIRRAIGRQGIFDYLVDGSLILEADQMYEQIPLRTLQTYLPNEMSKLMADQDKVLDKSQFDTAVYNLNNGEPARVLIEQNTVTKNGLQIFPVDKVDHLIPPHVFDDKDVRFRGRRMYLTKGDLELLSSDSVRWYDKAKVESVLGKRRDDMLSRNAPPEEKSRETLNPVAEDASELFYDWASQDENLVANKSDLPYTATWAIYRVTCKYGYKTKADPKGLIPKWCVFDYDPESKTILRANIYPHFHEKPNWFHFKMGYAPNSYYGFGFGKRLYADDLLESNAVGLYMEGVALSTIKPFKCVSPEFDGLIPFADGFGPGKIGYVRQMTDFMEMDMQPPPEAMLRNILPLIQTRSENRTGVTSLVQGRAESTDPRSPASKTNTLLGQAYVNIDSMIEDFSLTGWEPLAAFVWSAEFEKAVFDDTITIKDKINFSGVMPDLEQVNTLSLQELQKPIVWKAQASSDFINAEVRETQFLRHFQFFQPLLMEMSKFNPQLYQKYFMRWMNWAAQELNIRGMKYLMPTPEEFATMPPQASMGMMQNMLQSLKGGAGASGSPQNMPMPDMGGGGEGGGQ